ncbi:MAG: hypothetical protein ACRC3B_13815 [Bacteroidia bacterium]
MVKKKKNLLNFEIDKLTNSIENVVTGESFATIVLPVSVNDLKSVTKKNGWLFNWKKELKEANRLLFKLVTVENPLIIQGLLSITLNDGYVLMNLIENAPFNRSKNKMYYGVMGNLVAFACKTAFACGCEGYVSFMAKTALIDHYVKKLGASHEGGQLVILYPEQSLNLVKKYFNTI